ncbi:MAG: hypothetical protein M3Q63_03610 [bacterium]|nr:hypothetical protein [bacterium]
MSIDTKRNNKGFIKTLLVIAVALIVLGYFNVDIKKVIDSPMVQHNLEYGTAIAKSGFDNVKGWFAKLIEM